MSLVYRHYYNAVLRRSKARRGPDFAAFYVQHRAAWGIHRNQVVIDAQPIALRIISRPAGVTAMLPGGVSAANSRTTSSYPFTHFQLLAKHPVR